MKKYRKEGIGKAVAKQIFNLHKGQWEVYQLESNKPAQIFWNKTIDEYTQGRCFVAAPLLVIEVTSTGL
ncbi:hypothetical protein [Paenibacillus sp. Soil522]|uniref:hypothetical protein n=1 Tax=Paenibacillus sp. Soil522 TaxID=1736388 RepID=UPI0026A5C8AD